MTPLSQMTLGELLSNLRDITVILGTLTIGWKLRSWLQPLYDFFKRANKFFELSESHIQRVESGMQVLLNNHLSHIQSDLGHISGREPRTAMFAQDSHDDKSDVSESLEA